MKTSFYEFYPLQHGHTTQHLKQGIAEVVRGNATTSKELSAEGDTLGKSAEDLRKMLEQFVLEENSSRRALPKVR